MNRILISCLAFLLFSLNGISQDSNEDKFKKFKINLHAAPGVSWLKPADNKIVKGKSTVNFGFGMDVDVMFTENYALGTGLTVMKYGGNLTYFNETEDDSLSYIVNTQRKYKLQYVEIPITLKLRTKEIGYMTYWGQFGLGLGVNIKSLGDDEIEFYNKRDVESTDNEWEEYDVTKRPSDSLEGENIKDDVQIFRTSLIMGAGFEYNISGSTAIIVGVIYNNGFSNVMSINSKGIEAEEELPVINSNNDPKEFKMKSVSNQISLKVGIMF